MKKVIIKHKGDLSQVEIDLEKALNSIRTNRELKEIPDKALRELIQKANEVRKRLIDEMIEEIVNEVIR